MAEDFFARNTQWAKPMADYRTTLDATNEQSFRNWLAHPQNAQRIGQFDPNSPTEDYDMRGWWMQNGGAMAPADHFPDTFKTPYHESFSNESIYAGKNAPRWERRGNKDALVAPSGAVLVEE